MTITLEYSLTADEHQPAIAVRHYTTQLAYCHFFREPTILCLQVASVEHHIVAVGD